VLLLVVGSVGVLLLLLGAWLGLRALLVSATAAETSSCNTGSNSNNSSSSKSVAARQWQGDLLYS
jgi:hypothetical protein